MSFCYKGELEISKSWMNRALIMKSYSPQSLNIVGDSQSDDVRLLKNALRDLSLQRNELCAGLGGTTFRFLALRVSREVGDFIIRADKKLLKRPQQEIIAVLEQLGVSSQLSAEGLIIKSRGWQKPDASIRVSAKDSSQFLSAVLLNSINLPFDLEIALEKEITSEGYFNYTISMLKNAGLVIDFDSEKMHIPQKQILKISEMYGELDVSSAFTLIAAAVLAGEVEIINWSKDSLQPDMIFMQIFQDMGLQFLIENHVFKLKGPQNIKPIRFDLQNAPDLFPVLAVLCAFASGESHLYGAHQLVHKESNRIAKTCELLERCGFKVAPLVDGLKIQGEPLAEYKRRDLILFDPDHDHRMAFAASLLKLKGFPIMLSTPEVVNKSYPQFYQHVGLDMGMVIA